MCLHHSRFVEELKNGLLLALSRVEVYAKY
jgi:hypothetical protein